MKKKILSLILSSVLIFSLFFGSDNGTIVQAANGKTVIDNSSLTPKWAPLTQATVDDNNTPDWVSDLIIVGANLHRVLNDDGVDAGKEAQNLQTPNNKAIKLLDHLEEMGVNGLWVNPINDRGKNPDGSIMGNGYANLGLNTIDTYLTGETDYAKGWQVFRKFVDEAHKRNIRVIIDIVSWGVLAPAEVYQQHKEDLTWFTSSTATGIEGTYFSWGESDWTDDDGNMGLKEWFVSEAVKLALTTNCDGFRYDLEPEQAGPLVDFEIKNRLAQKGIKFLSISESWNDRGVAYDFEQNGLGPIDGLVGRAGYDYMEEQHVGSENSRMNDEGGSYRFYTHALSNHDLTKYLADGSELTMGYSLLYSPFIPLWYAGEETIAKKQAGKGVLYDTPIDLESDLQDKDAQEFYESVKQMIRIRRQYKDLFVNFPEHFYDTNICKVNVDNCETIQPYARYAGNRAALIIPNNNIHDPDAAMTVHVPFKACGLDYYSYYRVTDLISGKVIAKGNAKQIQNITLKVPHNSQRVLLVEAGGKFTYAPSESDGYYSENDGYTYFEDEDLSVNETEQNTSKRGTKTIVTKRKKRSNSSSWLQDNWPWVLAGSILGVILIAGAVVTVIVVKKKRGRNKKIKV